MARAGDELVNPLTGERIVFRRTAAETAGRLLEMDDFWTRPGHRAPEHVHPQMQERWEILAGNAAFRIGGVERIARPGQVVVATAGVPHLAWNPIEEPVVLRIQMSPALGWEAFIERLFALACAEHAAPPAVPDPAPVLELLSEFPREIALAPAHGAARTGVET
jgi:mannose-6-phosphate isomerase-like protein (cupin superfamily)